MKRLIFFLYGLASYALFFATFLYAIGFLGDFVVPKTMNSGPDTPLGLALLIDVALLGVFAIQHSVMARPGFKRRWTRIVPEPIERSTYCLFSSLAMILLFWQWRPLGGVVWDVSDPTLRAVLYGLFGCGWLLILTSTFLLNHFDLFGLRQVWLHLRGKPYTPLRFETPAFYRLVRHPLYVGWLVTFWAAPTMSVAHLAFALITSAYILVAIQFEERDLIDALGEDYVAYKRRVPMLVPGTSRSAQSDRALGSSS